MSFIKGFEGNDTIITHMEKSLSTGSISHAYILSAPFGMGKKTLANAYAKALNCEGDALATCSCPSCILFNSGSHPDTFWIRPDKKKSTSVESIRENIVSTVSVRPYRFVRKVYIIDCAHMMTVQAQNALLRTIEEPPSYAVFLLLTENTNKLLPTILSRCVQFRLQPPSMAVVERLLSESGYTALRAKAAAALALCSIGRARTYLEDDNFWAMRTDIVDLFSGIKTGNYHKIIDIFPQMEQYKDRIQDVITILQFWLRDLLVFKSTQDKQRILSADILEDIIYQAQQTTYLEIYAKIEALQDFTRQLEQNASFAQALDAALLKMV